MCPTTSPEWIFTNAMHVRVGAAQKTPRWGKVRSLVAQAEVSPHSARHSFLGPPQERQKTILELKSRPHAHTLPYKKCALLSIKK